jgi:type II secretory pathway predicted ATPase ExeA
VEWNPALADRYQHCRLDARASGLPGVADRVGDGLSEAKRSRLGVFAALDQRIATRYQLAPMDPAEAAQYLRHHLALVGRTDPLFADDAVARLHKLSLGLPRALNNVDIAALIAAATAGKALVDDDCAKKAVAELTRD